MVNVKSLVILPVSARRKITEDKLLAAGIKLPTIDVSVGTEHIDDIMPTHIIDLTL